MKKLLALAALLAVSVIIFVGCSKQANDGQTGQSQTTFTVGFDAEFPPYGFLGPDGKYKGFDLDLAAEVAKRNGWKMIPKAIDWAAKDGELSSGAIDCIWNGFTITEERKEQYTWSEPYVQNKQVILVKKGANLATFADLNGKIVAAQDGSSGAEAMESKLKETQEANAAFSFKEFKKIKDYVTAKTMLESGAIDALAVDNAVAEGFISKAPDTFVLFAEPLMFEEYGVGFKKGNTDLRDIVQRTLHEMVNDGTAAKICAHWATAEAENGGNAIDFILK